VKFGKSPVGWINAVSEMTGAEGDGRVFDVKVCGKKVYDVFCGQGKIPGKKLDFYRDLR